MAKPTAKKRTPPPVRHHAQMNGLTGIHIVRSRLMERWNGLFDSSADPEKLNEDFASAWKGFMELPEGYTPKPACLFDKDKVDLYPSNQNGSSRLELSGCPRRVGELIVLQGIILKTEHILEAPIRDRYNQSTIGSLLLIGEIRFGNI